MRVCNFTFLFFISSLITHSFSLRSNFNYAFIAYQPIGVNRHAVLTNSNCNIWPCIYTARDKLIENKKYTLPIFTAVVVGLVTKFVPKMVSNLFSFKSKPSLGSDSTRLNAYRCTKCNYTMYPARNRDGKFVGEKFNCPSCNAPFSSFVTRNY